MSERVLHILAPHFTVGVVLVEFKVVKAPPIVRYMIGWSEERVRAYVRTKKGWQISADW